MNNRARVENEWSREKKDLKNKSQNKAKGNRKNLSLALFLD